MSQNGHNIAFKSVHNIPKRNNITTTQLFIFIWLSTSFKPETKCSKIPLEGYLSPGWRKSSPWMGSCNPGNGTFERNWRLVDNRIYSLTHSANKNVHFIGRDLFPPEGTITSLLHRQGKRAPCLCFLPEINRNIDLNRLDCLHSI